MSVEPFLEPIDIVNASQVAYEKLREGILAHHFRPGQQLQVKSVAQHLGLSITPVNQALARLAEDGLVRILPRRGTFVADLTPAEVKQLVEARVAVDVFAARLAVQRARDADVAALRHVFQAWKGELLSLKEGDTMPRAFPLVELDMKFHRTLVEMADNRFLLETIQRLQAQVLALVRGKFWVVLSEYQNIALAGHTAIVDTLAQRDEEGLAQAVHNHLWDTYHIQTEMMERARQGD